MPLVLNSWYFKGFNLDPACFFPMNYTESSFSKLSLYYLKPFIGISWSFDKRPSKMSSFWTLLWIYLMHLNSYFRLFGSISSYYGSESFIEEYSSEKLSGISCYSPISYCYSSFLLITLEAFDVRLCLAC